MARGHKERVLDIKDAHDLDADVHARVQTRPAIETPALFLQIAST